VILCKFVLPGQKLFYRKKSTDTLSWETINGRFEFKKKLSNSIQYIKIGYLFENIGLHSRGEERLIDFFAKMKKNIFL
jgi:hypothetical protein